jgi:formylmethanofuran dehydrogenase subunit B
VVCPGCGCLCDDLVVEVSSGTIVDLRRACDLGRAWFAAAGAMVDAPEATIDGRAVPAPEAVGRAAEILRAARAPVVFGLTRTSTETVREALALADALGARVVLGRGRHDVDRVWAFQNAGRVGATLGEVKNRADVVIYWGCDPSTTHPRHSEHYTLEPRGRFVPEGRAGRFLIVVDDRPTATAHSADLVVPSPGDHDLDLIATLRLGLRRARAGGTGGSPTGDRGPSPTGGQAASATPPSTGPSGGLGLEPGLVSELLTRLKGARYGALFFQPRVTDGGSVRRAWEAISALVRDLNEHTRFVLSGLGAPGNLAGAEAAMTWQAGYPQGVDYGPGFPTELFETVTLDEILAARETDAVLAIADPFPDNLSAPARSFLGTTPTVTIAPDATRRAGGNPSVALNSSTFGVDTAGTVTRVDGVVLPLRPWREARFPHDRVWLKEIQTS